LEVCVCGCVGVWVCVPSDQSLKKPSFLSFLYALGCASY